MLSASPPSSFTSALWRQRWKNILLIFSKLKESFPTRNRSGGAATVGFGWGKLSWKMRVFAHKFRVKTHKEKTFSMNCKNMKSESNEKRRRRRRKNFGGIIQIEMKLRSSPTHINKRNFSFLHNTQEEEKGKNGLTFTMLIKRMNKLLKFETSFIFIALTYSYWAFPDRNVVRKASGWLQAFQLHNRRRFVVTWSRERYCFEETRHVLATVVRAFDLETYSFIADKQFKDFSRLKQLLAVVQRRARWVTV